MSKIRVNEIVNQTNDGPVDFPLGLTQNGLPIEAEGQIEYTENGKFESNIDDWLVTGQGALAQDTIDPLIGVGSLEITNNYTDTRFAVSGTINTVDNFYISKGRPLAASFDYDLISTAVDGDYTYEIFDGTNPVPGTVVDLKPGFNSVYVTFIPKTGITYTHRIRDVDGTNADTIKIDNVSCTPETRVVGAVITEWQSYTPTLPGFGAPTNIVAQYRQVGKNYEVIGEFIAAGTMSGEQQISLPNNYTVQLSSTNTQIVGKAERGVSTDTMILYHVLATNGDTFINIGRRVQGDTTNGFTPQASSWLGSGERFAFNFSVPIAELDGTIDMLTASRVHENARFYAQLTVTQILSNSSNVTPVNMVAQVSKNVSWDQATAALTIESDGEYEVAVNHYYAAAGTGTFVNMQARLNNAAGTGFLMSSTNDVNGQAAAKKIINLVRGDIIYIRFESDGTTQVLGNATTGFTGVSITRISDRSADSGLGYGIATSDTYGLVKSAGVYHSAYNTAIVNVDTSTVDLETYTVTKAGTYLVHAYTTFDNQRNNSAGDRAIRFDLLHDGVIVADAYCSIANVTTGNEATYVGVSKVVVAEVGDIIKTRAVGTVSSTLRAFSRGLTITPLALT